MQPGGSSADDNLYATTDSVSFGRLRETECALRDFRLEKSDEDYKKLIEDIASSGQGVAASRAFFQETIDDSEAELLEKRSQLEGYSFKRFFEQCNTTRSLDELMDLAELTDWRIEEADRVLIEENTRGQSMDPLWFKLRF